MTLFFRRIFTHVFCWALVAVATAVTAVPARADVESVLRQIQRTGSARVIIRMKADSGAAAWAPTQAAPRQRAAVAAAAERIQPALRNAQVQAYKSFRTLPYVAATVNQEQLLNLVGEPNIESVSLVRIERKHAVETPQLGSSVPSIDVADAWANGYLGQGYSVAVIDGGFNVAHPMLQGKNHGDACFSTHIDATFKTNCPSGVSPQIGPGAASNCPVGSTRCNHGTSVASIAVGNDGSNFGVARSAKLVPIDVASTTTFAEDCAPFTAPCDVTDSEAVLRALDYINENFAALKIAAVNYSYGANLRDGYCDDDLRKPIIDMLREKGIAVAISAGNEGQTGKITAPACISSAIAVGASNDGTAIFALSNFAPTLDFMAPGISVRAAGGSGSGFNTESGTSMSAPHVAGAWALMRSAFPMATFEQLETALKQTGLPVTRQDAGYSVPKIQVAHAIDRLNGKDRRFFNNTVSSSGTALGESYLRFYNNSVAGGTVTITLRDIATGGALGTWTSPNIPPRSAPQISIKLLEEKAIPAASLSLLNNTRAYYNLEVTSTFTGYLQHVLWARNAGVFANLSSCAGGVSSDATVVQNVHASALGSYVSRLRLVNTGATPDTATLVFYNPNSGAELTQWVSPEIPAGATLEVTMPQIEDLTPLLRMGSNTGLLQYNVRLTGFSGYIQHVIENQIVGALVDMSSKCELGVVTTNTSDTTTTAPARTN